MLRSCRVLLPVAKLIGVGAPAPPKVEKKFRRNLLGKFVSAPRGRARINFRTCFAGPVVHLVVLACVLGATTKKRSSTFFEEKSAPPEKILARLPKKANSHDCSINMYITANNN